MELSASTQEPPAEETSPTDEVSLTGKAALPTVYSGKPFSQSHETGSAARTEGSIGENSGVGALRDASAARKAQSPEPSVDSPSSKANTSVRKVSSTSRASETSSDGRPVAPVAPMYTHRI